MAGSAETKLSVDVGGRRLALSNLDKVLYPAAAFTKGQVIDYYARIASAMLPHLEGRPVTLRRFPNGVDAPSFYHKNAPRGAPSWLVTYSVPGDGRPRAEQSDSPLLEFVGIGDVASLVYTANLAALELHVPQWRVGPDGEPGRPDLIVFDLDPGAPATIVECCRVARLIEAELAADGMVAFPKTSGSKGLQLYARVAGTAAASHTSTYAKELAERLTAAHPDQVLSVMRKDLRGGKVFIDWSQNSRAKTTVAPYSLRARELPTVSTPITWDEVDEVAATGDAGTITFQADDVVARVGRLGDLFERLSPV
jgi:bifunctional non-homologous end joining protein LigD